MEHKIKEFGMKNGVSSYFFSDAKNFLVNA